MDIPVFHDDQHGTAVICAAGLINALHLTEKRIEDVRIVLNGAGAAGIACIELLKSMGARGENCLVCDTKGVIWQGRTDGMNQWKSAHAVDTELRTLEEAMRGADVFLGVSAKGAVTPAMVASMARDPVIFAMANPDPEITPEEAHAVRADAIVATGRSDYPNQVNNVLGFPYLFRGALDVRARAINDAMKIACAEALAALAREPVPDEVALAYGASSPSGATTSSPRPSTRASSTACPRPWRPRECARGSRGGTSPTSTPMRRRSRGAWTPRPPSCAASTRGPARPRPPSSSRRATTRACCARPSPTSARGSGAPSSWAARRRCARRSRPRAWPTPWTSSPSPTPPTRPTSTPTRPSSTGRLQRRGFDAQDIHRLAARDRHVFAALMLAHGHGDGMVTGATRKSAQAMDLIGHVFDLAPSDGAVGVTAVLHRGRIVLVADTLVHEWPMEQDLALIARRGAQVARDLGLTPRVAFLSFSTFGHPVSERATKMHMAPRVLDEEGADFEYEGEMTVDVALNPKAAEAYPFSRLTGPANVLVMPARHSASISVKLLQEMAGATVIGPILTGVPKPIQLCARVSTAGDILNMAVMAAAQVDRGGAGA
jgi:malate dehydrogenase (oxaloacetate-decarboxylating)(NADP+)